jgi:lysophospholipase L1-like esterase
MLKSLLLSVLFLSLAAGAAETPRPEPVRYRGFTVATLDKAVLEEAVDRWHANQVRYMMCPVWRAPNSAVGHYQAAWRKMIAELPAGLDHAKALGLAVVLDLHQLPDDHPRTYPADPKRGWWYDEENLKMLIACWQELATICKDRDQVIWFDLLNEPLEWSVVHSTPSYPPTWPAWAQKTIDAIRQIDRRHPIAIEPGPGMLNWGFTGFPPLKDPYQPVIYSVHLYQPVTYTHQGVNHNQILPWPGDFPSDGGAWDARRLEGEVANVVAFQKQYGVRIWVGEFSVARWAPNGAAYLRDCLNIFEKYGWDWNYHALREAAVWSLDQSDEVDLYDAKGKYVRTGLAVPNANLFYAPYGTPEIGKPAPLQGLTDRGKVVKEYLDRNLAVPAADRLPYSVNRLLVVGDSITRHPPAEHLSWKHDWGMAASSAANDFAHRLQTRLAAGQGRSVELVVDGVGGGTVAGKIAAAKDLAAIRAEVVVIQLGENDRVPEEVFRQQYAALVELLRQANPGAHLVCTGVWSPPNGQSGRNDTIRDVCRQYGVPFADLTAAGADRNNMAGVSGQWAHPGVGWHPGDSGMAAYADAIFGALRAGDRAIPAVSAAAAAGTGPVAGVLFQEAFTDPAAAGLFIPAGLGVREATATGFALRVNAVKDATLVRRALPVAALKGHKVLFTARVKTQGLAAGNRVVVRLELLNAEGVREQLTAAVPSGTGGWTEIRLPAFIPGNTVTADLVLGLAAAPGTAWFSDLRLVAAP